MPRVHTDVQEMVVKYSTISLPEKVMKAVDDLIKDPGYWPSRSAFAREACLEKIHREVRRQVD